MITLSPVLKNIVHLSRKGHTGEEIARKLKISRNVLYKKMNKAVEENKCDSFLDLVAKFYTKNDYVKYEIDKEIYIVVSDLYLKDTKYVFVVFASNKEEVDDLISKTLKGKDSGEVIEMFKIDFDCNSDVIPVLEV